MSRAELYQGLGAGLMNFGSNFAHLQAENAEKRRDLSLALLRRQWGIEDSAREWALRDTELDKRLEAQQSQLDQRLGAQEQQLDRKLEAAAPLHAAQTRAYDALANQREDGGQQSGKGPFGLIRPNTYTPDSLQAFQDEFNATGEQPWGLLVPRTDLRQDQAIEAELYRQAAEVAQDLLPAEGGSQARDPVTVFTARMPDQAAAYGVESGEPYAVALRKIQEGVLSQLRSSGPMDEAAFGGEEQPSGGLLDFAQQSAGGQEPGAEPSLGGEASGGGLLGAGPADDPGQAPPNQILSDAEQVISAGGGLLGAGDPMGAPDELSQMPPEQILADAQEQVADGIDPTVIVGIMRQHGVSEDVINEFMRTEVVRRHRGMIEQ